jgi:hypothetical protein
VNGDADEGIYSLFPYHVEVKPLENETHLDYWKRQIGEDIEITSFEITGTTSKRYYQRRT